MPVTPRSLLASVLIGAVLIAGCGSSSKSSSTKSTTSTPAAASTASTASTSTPAAAATTSTPTAASTSSTASSTSASSVSSSPAVQQAVAACKSSINAAPTLTSDEKSKLDNLCTQAASGNATDIKKATSEVCIDIVKDSVPAAEQSSAEAACPKA
jgi:hypothetical protein